MKPPGAEKLSALFKRLTRSWHSRYPREPRPGADLDGVARALHYFNFSLWHFEDEARRTDVPDSTIARAKRSIDSFNQKRNDAVERFDELMADTLARGGAVPGKRAVTNTETPGAAVDRLSILVLKTYHMNEEARRRSASDEHRKSCAERLRVLGEQRDELCRALDALMAELRAGKKRMRLYRQFKMYNDPELNPALYKKKGRGGKAAAGRKEPRGSREGFSYQ